MNPDDTFIPEVSLNGGAHRRSMASIEHVDSPKRQVTDVTSASIEEEEAQPTEVWAEKTEEAIQHENSEKTEKSQESWSNLLHIQSHAYRHVTDMSWRGRGGRLEFESAEFRGVQKPRIGGRGCETEHPPLTSPLFV